MCASTPGHSTKSLSCCGWYGPPARAGLRQEGHLKVITARDATARIIDELTATGKTANPRQINMFGKYAKTLLEKGAEPDDVMAWAEHYGKRLAAGVNIKPSSAWEDVQAGLRSGVVGGDGAQIAASTGAASPEKQRRAREEARARAADDRVNQALERGLIDADPREPLTDTETRRARRVDQWLVAWRNRSEKELEESWR